ncbi:hypothetical protein Hamer_G026538 [Homarus americanus]|uniref:Uncharacterized protein n=1 Tax=Homarus americanus TaxID=6706 RepID=A0A8J5JM27_HOMAM|nr:hypothetical protein Hamer_G026538 [Homarus americanus]
MDEDKFADNTNKKYWNWRMLFQQPTLLFFIKWFSQQQQQQQQQNKCVDSWTFEDGLLIMGMGYLMGYLFNSVLLVSVIIAIMIIARSVIKRRSITVNSIKQQQQQQQQQQQNECGGLWTFRDGYIIMVMGTLFLCVMLVVWVITAIMVIRRLINSIRQDSLLQDNDTLVSSETPPPETPPPEMPPPSYFELEIDDQNCCDYNSITSTLMTPPLGTAVINFIGTDLYAEATETNVEKFIGTADTADKLQENNKFADKQDFAEKFAEKFSQKFQQQQQQQQQQNECGGSWTFRDGYIIMVMGYMFNLVVLVVLVITAIMVIRRVIKRRSITVNSIRQDSLPDNDTRASSETPPPSYFELEIDDQNCCDYNSSITSMLTTPPPATHLPFKIKTCSIQSSYSFVTPTLTLYCNQQRENMDQQLKQEHYGSQPFDEGEKKKLQLLDVVLKAEFAELEEEKRRILDEKEQFEEKKRLLDEKEELDVELGKLKAEKEELDVESAKLKAVFADLGKKKRLLDEKKEQFDAELDKLKAEFAELEGEKKLLVLKEEEKRLLDEKEEERKKRQLDGELAKLNFNLAELDELKAKLKGQEVELDELKAKLKDEFSQLTELRKTLQVLNAEFREREKEKLFDTELEKKRRSYVIVVTECDDDDQLDDNDDDELDDDDDELDDDDDELDDDDDDDDDDDELEEKEEKEKTIYYYFSKPSELSSDINLDFEISEVEDNGKACNSY